MKNLQCWRVWVWFINFHYCIVFHCSYIPQFIHIWAKRHFHHLQLYAIVNSAAAVNILVSISLCSHKSISLETVLRSRILVLLLSIYQIMLKSYPKRLDQFIIQLYIPTNSCYCQAFNVCQFDWHETVSWFWFSNFLN